MKFTTSNFNANFMKFVNNFKAVFEEFSVKLTTCVSSYTCTVTDWFI